MTAILGELTIKGNTLLGRVVAPSSYVGNSDPGLVITAITLGTIRSDYEPYHSHPNGWGGCGFFTTTGTAHTVKALCRYKGPGNNQIHEVYIVDDIDPIGNLQCTAQVDMSVGNVGDWICTDLAIPWTGVSATSYNILSSEETAGDHWYGDDTQVVSLHTGYVNLDQIGYSTHAYPQFTTIGDNSPMVTYGPVNFIVIP